MTTTNSKTKKPDRRPAKEGELFRVDDETLARGLCDDGVPGVVRVCAKTDGDQGQWFCISCCKPLESNWDKDSHCAKRAPKKTALINPSPEQLRARHVLAWRNYISWEIEVP